MDLERELDALYALVHSHDCMHEVAKRLTLMINAASCGIGLQDSRSYDVIGGWTYGIANSFLLSYRDKYCHCDPTVVEHFELPPDRAYASEFTGDDPKFQATEFYQGWCVPQQMHYFAGTYTQLSHHRTLRMTFQRRSEQGDFGAADLAVIDQFTPHVRRITEINSSFSELALSQASLQHTLNRMPHGLILLDSRFQVMSVNMAARAAFDDNFQVQDERLKISPSDKQTALVKLLEEALVNNPVEGKSSTGTLHLERAGGQTFTLLVSAFKLDTGILISPYPETMVAVLVQDPNQTVDLDDAEIARQFKLSNKESILVRHLCQGRTLEEIHKLLKVSIHTVRDHLKSVFRKTGTTRQAELVAHVLLSTMIRTPL